MTPQSPFQKVIDAETEWELVPSGCPPSVDGRGRNEQKFMRCYYCGAQAIIDGAGKTETGIHQLVHKEDCPQRDCSERDPVDPGDAFDSPDL